MPDDRLFHKRAGHGARVNQLSHLEYRVWSQYILSADDFGVMRQSAKPIQADNDALDAVPIRHIEKALTRLVDLAIVVTFAHQGRPFICQRDWQTFQKIDYPRGTHNPKPTDDVLGQCDEPTRKLFDLHPGGKGRKKQEPSPNGSDSVLRTVFEPLAEIRDYARERPRETAQAKTNGSDERLPANGSEGSARETASSRGPLMGSHANCATHVAGFCVPHRLHEKLIALCRGMEEPQRASTVDAFYRAVEADPRWQSGPVGTSDVFRFLQDRWEEHHGGAPKKSAKEIAAEKAWAEL